MTTRTQATVKLLGTFAGGSYGFGRADEIVDLYYIDCPESRCALSGGTVSGVGPWVYGGKQSAADHLSGEYVLVEGHGCGRRVITSPAPKYAARAAKVLQYEHRNDIVVMTVESARTACTGSNYGSTATALLPPKRKNTLTEAK